MTLTDVYTVLAERFPPPFTPRGTSGGLELSLDGKVISVGRRKVKDCADMDALRAYVGGLIDA